MVMAGARRAAAAADRPRRAARHRPRVRRAARRDAARHRRRCSASVARHQLVRRAEARKAEGIVEEEIQAFAGWLGSLEVLPTLDGAARARRRGRRRAAGRERGPLGVADRRATASASRRSPAPRVKRLLHEPTLRVQRARRRAPPRPPAAAARAVRARGAAGGGRARRGRPRSARCAARVDAAADRHPRQRAGARPGALRSPSGSAASRDRRDHHRGRRRRARAATSRAGSARSRRALLAGEIDLAVHSAKDVPGELAEGTAIVAAPRARGPARRARSASAARRACARARGSAPARCAAARSCSPCGPTSRSSSCAATSTRGCASCAAGEVDALVLAAAGLERLGRRDEAGAPLDGELFVPGARARACSRSRRAPDDHARRAARRRPHDAPPRRCLHAERAAVRALGASCHTPVGRATRGGGCDARLRRAARRLGVGRSTRSAGERRRRRSRERMLAAGAGELLARPRRWRVSADRLPRRRRARATRAC